MRNANRVAGSKIVVILALISLSACGGDDEPGSPGGGDDDACIGEGLTGPEGGTVEVSDPGNFTDGLRIVVSAGSFDVCRSLYVDEHAWAGVAPAGCFAYTRWDDQFNLGSGYPKPYGAELEIHFPVAGMVVEEGETPCAFGKDIDTEDWLVILPDSYDGATMTVTTTFHDYWTWGKIDLDAVSTEHLTGAMEEQYGDALWNTIEGGIIEAIQVLYTLYIDRSCATWTRVRDVDLPALIEARRGELVSYQSQIAACGTCELFSLDFGLDLSGYLVARVVILAADLWDLFFGDWAGYMPFLGNVEFGVHLQRYIAVSFIENQECSYPCVTQELGLGVYSTYATYHVYLVTHTIVGLAISNGFWVACR
ncbi:MAG: hypothetical protein GY838_02215 [bacterium]|nr:hypothetical protein [bacterium]